MKLVEILARELKEWPYNYDYMGQCVDRDLVAFMNNTSKTRYMGIYPEMADDQDVAIVTRPQWQAERDRMKAMEEISKFSQEQDQLQHPVSPTYEQQLWDRVAQSTLASMLGATGGADFFVDDAGTHKAVSSSDFASCAADYADAFMAERAKRVGK